MKEEFANNDLRAAKKAKKDEFYTQLTDIEKELRFYKKFFKNKSVYCNCDDPKKSNFFQYFSLNFEYLGLKKLITTCYKNQNVDLFSTNKFEQGVYLEYLGDLNQNNIPDDHEISKSHLKGDGDFRSEECINLLKNSDVVVTNPPFSLFREYIDQLIMFNKKFLIIGNVNAITYKEVFKLFQENKIWMGASIKSGDREFGVPNDYPLNAAGSRVDENGNKFIRVKGVRWFTNIDFKERYEDIVLYKKYSQEEYPKYDNYDAINIDKTKDIPKDYKGVMGVPITFIDKYNPDQFEILGITDRSNSSGLRTKKYTAEDSPKYNDLNARSVLKTVKGYKAVYARLLIRNKKL
tara:strand:- start:195 stop:1241 length:1047 start_codon:yes stop_codon:yes gene_type:complete